MKKILFICIILPIFIFANDIWINNLEFEDLFGSNLGFPGTKNLCVIPANDGGYIVSSYIVPADNIFSAPQMIFFKVATDGEVEARYQDYETYGDLYCPTLVSNGVDKYYTVSNEQFGSSECKLIIMDDNLEIVNTVDLSNEYSVYRVNEIKKLGDSLFMIGRKSINNEYFNCLVKTDLEGTVAWVKDNDGLNFHSFDIKDNKLIACGYGSSPRRGSLVYFNTLGDTLSTSSMPDYTHRNVIFLESGNALVYSLKYDTDIGYIPVIIEFNQECESVYEHTLDINLDGLMWENFSSMLMKDGGLILLTKTDEAEIYKFNSNYELEWKKLYIPTFPEFPVPEYNQIGLSANNLIVEDTGHIVYVGTQDRLHDLYIIKTDEYGVAVENDDIEMIHTNDVNLHNYPNPFTNNSTSRNFGTNISFSIQEKSDVEVTVFNSKGQKIRKFTRKAYNSGTHSFYWNGKNENNQYVSSGIYLYKLTVDGKDLKTNKCLIIK